MKHSASSRVLLFLQLLFCFLVALLVAVPVPSTGQDQGTPTTARDTTRSPSPVEINHAIELATSYLERACGPDGKFVYQVNIASGRESPSYDIIRHAGAMYALAMANRAHPDPRAVAALTRAAKFLRLSYIGPGVRPGQQVVWSQPLAGGPDRGQSKSQERYAELGATGLGLVALAAVREVDPQSAPLEELQDLGRFALFLQRDDGSFVHKYLAGSGPVPNWQSPYYPGEAALGFIALYEADHSRKWLSAAGKALSYLARSRTGVSPLPADHWALIATAELLRFSNQIDSIVSREELRQHAANICNSILRDQFRGSPSVGLDGAFDPTGKTAPAATRLEGLLAALEFLPKGELWDRINEATNRGIAFLLRAQVTSGPGKGGVPGAISSRSRESSEIRIDYVQHNLCAWLRYRTAFNHGAR